MRRITPSFAAGCAALLAALPAVTRAQSPSRPDSVAADAAHAEIAAYLERIITGEMRDKSIPALSIALVDGSGSSGPAASASPTPRTMCPRRPRRSTASARSRSCSPTSAVMQLVEQGALDLDAPVHDATCPTSQPRNPFGTPITLRQLMSHRSGLVREPPVGHYFDPTRRLARRDGREPRTRRRWSTRRGRRRSTPTPAIAVVGDVVEQVRQASRSRVSSQRACSSRSGMTRASFEPTPALAPASGRGG